MAAMLLPALAEQMEKAALFDFNLTLLLIATSSPWRPPPHPAAGLPERSRVSERGRERRGKRYSDNVAS
jgi:hypothetical protein